jgi:hypothetical protein
LSQQPIPGTRLALARHGAGRSRVPYLALHPMGFSVPGSLRSQRWALTPPFHPYPALSRTFADRWLRKERGGLFSVALSVRMPRGIAARVYPKVMLSVTRHRALWCSDFPPLPGLPQEEAILRPSKIRKRIAHQRADLKKAFGFQVLIVIVIVISGLFTKRWRLRLRLRLRGKPETTPLQLNPCRGCSKESGRNLCK